MFETILKELKTKYKDLGLSETILKVTAERLANTVKEENEIENAVNGVQSEMKIYQSFADQNRTLQSEIQKLKKTEPINEPAPTEPIKPIETGVTNPNDAMLELLKEMKAEIDSIKTEKVQQTNTQLLTSKLNELGVNENFYKFQVQGKSFTDAEEINTFAQSVKEAEDAFLQVTNNTKLANSTNPLFGKEPNTEGVSQMMQNYLKSKEK